MLLLLLTELELIAAVDELILEDKDEKVLEIELVTGLLALLLEPLELIAGDELLKVVEEELLDPIELLERRVLLLELPKATGILLLLLLIKLLLELMIIAGLLLELTATPVLLLLIPELLEWIKELLVLTLLDSGLEL